MALSSHELYLVLRARDEATGVLRSFAQRLGQTDREIVSQQIAQIRRAREASDREAKDKIAGLQATRRERQRDMATTQEQINQVREQDRISSSAAQRRIAELRAQEVATGRSQTESIAMLRSQRAAYHDAAVQRAAELREEIVLDREQVRGTEEQIAAIRELQRVEAHEAATRVAALREQAAAQEAAAAEARSAATARMTRGYSFITGGVLSAAVGAISIHAFSEMASAAQEYNAQVARTETQTDKVKVSLASLADTGRQVASTYAVQFDEVQSSLYDIYSSMNVTAQGAAKILASIARASVAGAAPMEDTGRATIGIMNAYKLGAEDVNHVNDVMFQLVRKGVGTYKQFADTIGRSVPSAIRAGQSLESLAGMLAFLTRNGLSAAMASSSAARALDSIANFHTVESMKNFGKVAVSVFKEAFGSQALANVEKVNKGLATTSVHLLDAQGKMKPMVEIVHELQNAFRGMTKEQRSGVMQELLKGSGGTIQAMRFWNHALNDTNNLLGQMTTSMQDAGGATAAAYKTMANTPQAQIQVMNNRWQATKTIIGSYVLPLKLKLLGVLVKIMGAFGHLNPAMQKWITYLGLAAAATLLLGGLLAALVGIWVVFTGALRAAEVTMVGFATKASIIIAILAALAYGAYYVYKHWDQFRGVFQDIGKDFSSAWKPIQAAWNKLWPVLIAGAKKIGLAFEELVTDLHSHSGQIGTIFAGIGKFFATLLDLVRVSWPMISTIIANVIRGLIPVINGLLAIFSALGRVWDNMPQDARNVIVAAGLVAFAFRGMITSSSLWTNSIGRATTSIRTSFGSILKSGKALQVGLLSLGIGSIIGNYAGQIGGAKGKIAGALGGAAAGALTGLALGGGPWGAAIGALAGGISGLVTSWGKEDSAADLAKQTAVAALNAQTDAANTLLGALRATNGEYNLTYRNAVVQQLSKKLPGQTASPLQNAITGGINPYYVVGAAQGDPKALAQIKNAYIALQKKYLPYFTKGEKAGQTIPSQYFDQEAALKSLLGQLVQYDPTLKKVEQEWEAEARAMNKTLTPTRLLQQGAKGLRSALQGTGTALESNSNKYIANSQDASRNTATIKEFVDAAYQHSAASIEDGKSVQYATGLYFNQIGALEKTLAQMGFNKQAIYNLISGYNKVPSQVRTYLAQHGVTVAQIMAIVNTYGRIPHSLSTLITVSGVGNALTQLHQLVTYLEALNSGAHIGIDQQTVGGSTSGGRHLAGATGGWVRGPGGPTSDDVAAWLSNGEFVVNARQSKKYGKLLQDINNGRQVKAFARGGAVNFSPPGGRYAYLSSLHPTTAGYTSALNTLRNTMRNTRFPSLVQDLFGTTATLKHAADMMITSAHYVLTSVQGAALRTQESVLTRLSTNYNRLKAQIAAQVQRVQDMEQSRTELSGNVSQAVSGTFDIGSELGSFSDIYGDLSRAKKDADTFKADIAKLKAKGYGPYLISQLYAAGPAAIPTIESLLSASPGQVKAFMASYRGLNADATQIGTAVAANLYNAGIAAANGLILGLRKRESAVVAIMRQIATSMINELKKRLGIASPGKEFMSIGVDNMKGLENGHDKGFSYVRSKLAKHSTTLADLYRVGPDGSAPVGLSTGKTGAGKHVEFHEGAFQITTQEIDPVKHAADLGWEIARRVD
jgi:TP901 family phage tail tape measure protein